ncbi:MAG: proline dehydrogenase family protein [Candidatus Altiarchaeota archaeon]
MPVTRIRSKEALTAIPKDIRDQGDILKQPGLPPVLTNIPKKDPLRISESEASRVREIIEESLNPESRIEKYILDKIKADPKRAEKWIMRMPVEKYIAGATIKEGVEAVQALNNQGVRGLMDRLGEFIDTPEQAKESVTKYKGDIDEIAKNGLNSAVSFKLSMMGMGLKRDGDLEGLDDSFCFDNVKEVLDHAKKMGVKVEFDMENSPFYKRTVDMVKKFQGEGYKDLAAALQANIKDSPNQFEEILSRGIKIRWVRGVYRETDKSIAHTEPDDIRKAQKEGITKLLELAVKHKDKGAKVAIATHKKDMVNFALEECERLGIKPDDGIVEFQFLRGFGGRLKRKTVRLGWETSEYTPQGEDLIPYYARRIVEELRNIAALPKIKALKEVGRLGLTIFEKPARLSSKSIFRPMHESEVSDGLEIPQKTVDANLEAVRRLEAMYGKDKIETLLPNTELRATAGSTLEEIIDLAAEPDRKVIVEKSLPDLYRSLGEREIDINRETLEKVRIEVKDHPWVLKAAAVDDIRRKRKIRAD